MIRQGLIRAGHREVPDARDAEVLVFGACGVRGVWVEEAVLRVQEHLEANCSLRVIVTSCGPLIEGDRFRAWAEGRPVEFLSHEEILSQFTPHSFAATESAMGLVRPEQLPARHSLRDCFVAEKKELIEELRRLDDVLGVELLSRYSDTTKGLIFYHGNARAALVTVSRGCDFKCSFCAIPRGRGKHRSVPLSQIIERISQATRDTVEQLYFLAEDVGSYICPSTGAGFSELMSVADKDRGNLKFGLRYLEPASFLRHYDDIAECCKKGWINLLYIPLQSAAPRLLRLMNRPWDVREVCSRIQDIRECSDTVFYTNWMVGFPTELDDDFELSLDLAKQLCIDVNVVIPYSDRPGTSAAEIEPKVDLATKALRVQRFRQEMAAMKADMLLKQCPTIPSHVRSDLIARIISAELASNDDILD
ncbi:MAG: radical SAM protein [Armatimonadota bacterium]